MLLMLLMILTISVCFCDCPRGDSARMYGEVFVNGAKSSLQYGLYVSSLFHCLVVIVVFNLLLL